MPATPFVLSAFGDEISPDPNEQFEVLARCGVKHLELRSIHRTNVLDLADQQLAELKKGMLDHGFQLSAIGSPIGKVKIDDPWPAHWQRFLRAIEVAHFLATPRIRIFSFYPAQEGESWDRHRSTVIERLQQMTERAARDNVFLWHENEHRIYGEDPARVVDLMRTINHPHLRAVYDAANYVLGGFDPWQAWLLTKPWTVHFHIKDWNRGEPHGVPAGQGQGRLAEVLADAWQSGYQGFATLEPHLQGGGPTGGFTGPERFPMAVEALNGLLLEIAKKTNQLKSIPLTKPS